MTRKTILIVDDDRDLLLGLGIRLRSSGYHVIISLDAVGAVSVARRQEPDLILLDLGLPGSDGFAVLERLQRIGLSHVPVIVLTARERSYEERALRAGAVAFFQKPADNDELMAAIADALQESGGRVCG